MTVEDYGQFRQDFSPPDTNTTEAAVPSTTWGDVIGNKSDTHVGDSLYAIAAHTWKEHTHSKSRVYPTLADGVAIIGGAGAWAEGSLTSIVPANAITSDFDIHRISIEAISAVDVFELCLTQGPTDIEIGRVRLTKTAVMDSTFNIPFMTVIIPANAEIKAALSSKAGGSKSVDLSIFYHTY